MNFTGDIAFVLSVVGLETIGMETPIVPVAHSKDIHLAVLVDIFHIRYNDNQIAAIVPADVCLGAWGEDRKSVDATCVDLIIEHCCYHTQLSKIEEKHLLLLFDAQFFVSYGTDAKLKQRNHFRIICAVAITIFDCGL